METYRLKNIAILILLLLNAFLLMLLGYQYMQSRQSDEDMVEQMHVLFSGNQLSLSDSVDLLQPVLSPLTLSRSTEMEANMADALLGEDVESASQGGGIYSYSSPAGSLQFAPAAALTAPSSSFLCQMFLILLSPSVMHLTIKMWTSSSAAATELSLPFNTWQAYLFSAAALPWSSTMES